MLWAPGGFLFLWLPRWEQRREPVWLDPTHPRPPAGVVYSQSLAPAQSARSAPAARIVSTATGPHPFEKIDDATRVSLASHKSAVLVRIGPHEAQLVFPTAPAANPLVQ